MTVRLQPLDVGALIARQDTRDDGLDAEPRGDRACRARVVARQHDGGQPHALHLRDGCRARRFFRVTHAEEPRDTPISNDDERGLASVCHLLHPCTDCIGECDPHFIEQGGVARRTGRAADRAAHAFAEDRLKIGDGRDGETVLRRIARDGGGNRMLAPRFERGGERDEVV